MDEAFNHGVCIIRFVYLFKGLCTNKSAPGGNEIMGFYWLRFTGRSDF